MRADRPDHPAPPPDVAGSSDTPGPPDPAKISARDGTDPAAAHPDGIDLEATQVRPTVRAADAGADPDATQRRPSATGPATGDPDPEVTQATPGGRSEPAVTQATPCGVDPDATHAISTASPPTGRPPTSRPAPPAGRAPQDAGATWVSPPADPDATQVVPPVVDPDATQLVRPAAYGTGAANAAPPPPDGWKGQAAVRIGASQSENTGDWAPVEQGRAWWLPILLAIIALLFVVGIAFALLVVLKDKNATPPAPSVGPSTPSAPATPSPTPSASASPSTPASPAPSDSSGVTAEIPPNLVGADLTSVELQLQQLGLAFNATAQTDDTDPPNTVLSVTPETGVVPVATTVIQIVYAVPSSPSPSSAVPSGGPSSAG